MALRRIGLEVLQFSTKTLRQTSPNELHAVIDFGPAEQSLSAVYKAPTGEKALPPVAMFKALLLAARSRFFRCAVCRGARRPRELWALLRFWRDEATGDCGQGRNLENVAQRPSPSRPLPSLSESSVETTGHIYASKYASKKTFAISLARVFTGLSLARNS
jgi:hypothetical protein